MYELKIGYFASLENAQENELTGYDEIFTSGYLSKGDGGAAHYKKFTRGTALPPLGFASKVGTNTRWCLIPDNGTINPLQAGAKGDGTDDGSALQECIDYVAWWNDTTTGGSYTTVGQDVVTEQDSGRNAVKLVIPAHRTFTVDRRNGAGSGLNLTGPITIAGEDRFTSVIRLLENSEGGSDDGDKPVGSAAGVGSSLFFSQDGSITGIIFRNLTLRGSYGDTALDPTDLPTNGDASLFTFNDFTDVLFEDMVFTNNRAVMIGGDEVTNLTMRGCLMAVGRRGGLVVTNAQNVVVEDNDFRWIGDDPVAVTLGAAPADPESLAAGGPVRIVGNRSLGCRGLNVVGAKNVLIADNTQVLGRGRAIHIGCGTDQDKGDTTMLSVIVRGNIITDLLDAQVDPDQAQDQGAHRAIDVEMLQTATPAVGVPGLPDANGTIVDPALYHYSEGQGLQGRRIWRPGDSYSLYDPVIPAKPTNDDIRTGQTWWNGRIYQAKNTATTGPNPPEHTSGIVNDGTPPGGGGTPGVNWEYVAPADVRPVPQVPTPFSGNILIEGNVVSRTRKPVEAFIEYGLGEWGGFAHDYSGDEYEDDETVSVTLDEITPHEGIAVSGSVRNLIIRGNQIRNTDVAIRFYGSEVPIPFSLLDVTVVDNDLSDWKAAGIRFDRYETDPGTAVSIPAQRVSILNNRADGDPYHWNRPGVVRMPQGNWADTRVDIVDGVKTLYAGYGAFVDAAGLGSVTIAGNHVRNVPQLVAMPDSALHIIQGNVAYCNPAGLGYQPGNIGIGNLIAPQLGWRYIIEAGNPRTGAYGKVFNTAPLAVEQTANGAPNYSASVTWVEGTIVANLKPDPLTTGTYAGLRIWSWRRATTGAGNTLGTHWLPLTTKA